MTTRKRCTAGFSRPRIGSPALLALVVLGLFRTSWSGRRIAREAVLLVMAASIVFFVADGNRNRVQILFPVSAAAAAVGGKGRGRTRAVGPWPGGAKQPTTTAADADQRWTAGMRGAAGDRVFGLRYATSVRIRDRAGGPFHDARCRAMAAALQAGTEARRGLVHDRTVLCEGNAGAVSLRGPGADTALSRGMKQVDFVVLESQHANAIPTIGQWIAHGIPDKHAHLIYDNGNASGNRVLIYSWQSRISTSLEQVHPIGTSDRTRRPSMDASRGPARSISSWLHRPIRSCIRVS